MYRSRASRRRRRRSAGPGIYDSICSVVASMSGQRPYEGRIVKNVRGLFADTNAILLPVAASPQACLCSPSRFSFSSLFFRLSKCSNVFFSSTQSFTFNNDELSPVSLFISVYAVPFPPLTMFGPLGEYIVYPTRKSPWFRQSRMHRRKSK